MILNGLLYNLAFTEHLIHANQKEYTYIIPLTLWDRYYYRYYYDIHFVEKEMEA